MKKRPTPAREENVTPVEEKILSAAKGAGHVDNPAQAAMKDGPE